MKQWILPAALMALAACGGNAPKQADATKPEDTTATVTTAAAATVSLKNDALNAVLEHYEKLTEALVKGDVSGAKVAAAAIEVGAPAADASGKLAESAKAIGAAADINAQRVAYSSLNDSFIGLVKASGMNSGELHVEFCPMAFDNKGGRWISKSKDIRNPYFGDEMLTCGTVEETVK
ncbi:DUF3347 domain-containing protein [Chitinophaga deserti]|uniref:DUF3347 domain-containing protein n=1 Tax=Chitinophaga deserti TaxID=2164099 RepID=UPI000D6BACA6|nr:DUF3347 domain-containing protein [Chitinophaga deserti]